MVTNYNELTSLKNKISTVRKKLMQAWEARETTDALVLATGEEFDALMNEYCHLVKELRPVRDEDN
jgi:hypothetical protein